MGGRWARTLSPGNGAAGRGRVGLRRCRRQRQHACPAWAGEAAGAEGEGDDGGEGAHHLASWAVATLGSGLTSTTTRPVHEDLVGRLAQAGRGVRPA